MNYQTIFDITTAGYQGLTFVRTGLILFAVGLVIFILNEKTNISSIFNKFWTKPRLRTFSTIYAGFAAIWSLASFFATYSDYSRLKAAYLNNECEIVEGMVSQFIPMPFSGHALERFAVNDHSFSYSDFVLTGGFNNTQSHGGPIKEGLQVRIHCLGNKIAKLEIAR